MAVRERPHQIQQIHNKLGKDLEGAADLFQTWDNGYRGMIQRIWLQTWSLYPHSPMRALLFISQMTDRPLLSANIHRPQGCSSIVCVQMIGNTLISTAKNHPTVCCAAHVLRTPRYAHYLKPCSGIDGSTRVKWGPSPFVQCCVPTCIYVQFCSWADLFKLEWSYSNVLVSIVASPVACFISKVETWDNRPILFS